MPEMPAILQERKNSEMQNIYKTQHARENTVNPSMLLSPLRYACMYEHNGVTL